MDIGQVLQKFNTRLEALSRTRQSSFDLSLSDISTFNASSISSIPTEILPRASTPLDEVEVEPRVAVHDRLAQPEPMALHSVLTTMPALNPTVSSFVPITVTDLNRRFLSQPLAHPGLAEPIPATSFASPVTPASHPQISWQAFVPTSIVSYPQAVLSTPCLTTYTCRAQPVPSQVPTVSGVPVTHYADVYASSHTRQPVYGTRTNLPVFTQPEPARVTHPAEYYTHPVYQHPVPLSLAPQFAAPSGLSGGHRAPLQERVPTA